MGASMARHLQAAGHPLRVHTRTRSRAEPLLEGGAQWCDAPGEVAEGADAVISIVGFPEDVEAVYLAEGGVLDRARSGALVVDMTTSRPDLAQEVWRRARDKGIEALDAPVSGGDIGAREARLSIMVGGGEEAFRRALPLLGRMGGNIVRQGPAGAGQHAKMCNQIAIASGMVAICEALAYARSAGLDSGTVLQSIEKGAAGSWSLSNLAPRILKKDYSPGFFVKHFLKDMGIALDSASRMGLDLPGLSLARSLYERLAAQGGGDDGTQALFRLYQEGSAGRPDR